MAIRIPNTHAAQDAPLAPVRPDGLPYVYELIYAGGRWRAYADSPDELVSFLISGHEELASPAEQMQARIRYAVDVQVALQAQLAADGDLPACTPEQRAILLGSRDQPPTVEQWSAPVPLVLVTSFYQPTGPHRRPIEAGGRIWWLNPETDDSLLESLAAVGWIGLARNTPEQLGADE